jgi:hypothetical protein
MDGRHRLGGETRWWDGRLHKISEELAWEYDSRDYLKPWRVRGETVDLAFEPFHDRRARTELGVITAHTDQCFGHWPGGWRTPRGSGWSSRASRWAEVRAQPLVARGPGGRVAGWGNATHPAELRASYGRTVPDLVGPGVRLLIVGSTGVVVRRHRPHFARPGTVPPGTHAAGLTGHSIDASAASRTPIAPTSSPAPRHHQPASARHGPA